MERRTNSLNINSLLNKKQPRQRPIEPVWSDEDIGVLNLDDEESYKPAPVPKRKIFNKKQKPQQIVGDENRISGIKEYLFIFIGIVICLFGMVVSISQLVTTSTSVSQLKFLHISQIMMFVMLLFIYTTHRR